jgi:hypothetical protein
MAKKVGRPRKGEGEQETKHTRVFMDVAEWIGWIVRIEGGSSAQLLDPLIRSPIGARYKRIEHLVEQVKQAEAEAERLKKKRG